MYILGDIPRKWSRFYPDKECMVCYSYGEVRYKWEEFNERINCLANSLLNIGLRKGDHVAMLMENCHRFVELYYAMAKTGIIPVPLNIRLHLKELQYIIDLYRAGDLLAEWVTYYNEEAAFCSGMVARNCEKQPADERPAVKCQVPSRQEMKTGNMPIWQWT